MTATYTIKPSTLLAVAKLRELQVEKANLSDFKEFGRFHPNINDASRVSVLFRNGSDTAFDLPAKTIARWVGLLPKTAVMSIEASEGNRLHLRSGGSEVCLLATPMDPTENSILLDGNRGDHEFHLTVSAEVDGELSEIKKQLATIRGSAKATKELHIAQKNHREAFGALRSACVSHREDVAYIASTSLDEAVRRTKVVRDAKRFCRGWSTTLANFYRFDRRSLPLPEFLSAEDKATLTQWSAEYADADRKHYNRKMDTIAIKSVNLLLYAVQAECVRLYPEAGEPYTRTVHEKHQAAVPGFSVYAPEEMSHYSRARRRAAQWVTDRNEMASNYKLALARLNRAKNNLDAKNVIA